MPLNLNNNEVTGVDLNNTEVSEVRLNGQTVFSAGPDLPTFETQFWTQVDGNPNVSFSGDSQTIQGVGTNGILPPCQLVTVDEFDLGQDFDVVFDVTVNGTSTNQDWAFVPQVNPSNFTWNWGYGGRSDFTNDRLRFYTNQGDITFLNNSAISTSTFKMEVRPNGSNVDVSVFLDGVNKGNFGNRPYESTPQKLGWALQSADGSANFTISNLVITVN